MIQSATCSNSPPSHDDTNTPAQDTNGVQSQRSQRKLSLRQDTAELAALREYVKMSTRVIHHHVKELTCADDEAHGCHKAQAEDMEAKECLINRLQSTHNLSSPAWAWVIIDLTHGKLQLSRELFRRQGRTEKKLSKKVRNHHVMYTVMTIGKSTAHPPKNLRDTQLESTECRACTEDFTKLCHRSVQHQVLTENCICSEIPDRPAQMMGEGSEYLSCGSAPCRSSLRTIKSFLSVQKKVCVLCILRIALDP